MLQILSRLTGVYIAAMGAIFLVNPKALTPYTVFWEKKKRLYLIGGSRIIMGFIVLDTVPLCRLQVPTLIIGILLILAGLPYFFIKLDKQKTMVSRWRKRPLIMVRILGLFILGIGALLIYSV